MSRQVSATSSDLRSPVLPASMTIVCTRSSNSPSKAENSPGERTSGSLNRFAEARTFPFKTIAEVTSPHEAFDLVKEDAGIVLLPAGVCEALPRGVRAIRIADISPLETVLVHRADASKFTPQLAALIRTEMNLHFVGKGGEHSEETPSTARRKPPASTVRSKRETLSNRPAI